MRPELRRHLPFCGAPTANLSWTSEPSEGALV